MNTALLILGGLALLAVGGELLVRGAVRLAERLGVSPLLVGPASAAAARATQPDRSGFLCRGDRQVARRRAAHQAAGTS